MKDTLDSMQMARPTEQEGYSNRRLIRPSLNRSEHNHSSNNNHNNFAQAPMERRERPDRADRPSGGKKMPRQPGYCQPEMPILVSAMLLIYKHLQNHEPTVHGLQIAFQWTACTR